MSSPVRHYIEVSGLQVEVVRKAINNLHLGVYPPEGRVRVAVPLRVDDEAVRLAVISKLGWIRRQQQHFADQPRQSQREMVSGESHYFQGRRYRLNVSEQEAAAQVHVKGKSTLELIVRPGTDSAKRREILNQWYRRELKRILPELIAKWEALMGVQVTEWGIKRMKTRWGTCNIDARRIWINLEVAKKPPQCLEYIVVHEMVHLLERRHNDNFKTLMDQFMPQWRLYRDELNQAPLAHEDWSY
jgi:predicted metal-dependent hydrolase